MTMANVDSDWIQEVIIWIHTAFFLLFFNMKIFLIKRKYQFHVTKEITNKMQKQLMEWEKIITNHIDKGLISKIRKKFTQLNSKKTNLHNQYDLKIGRGIE